LFFFFFFPRKIKTALAVLGRRKPKAFARARGTKTHSVLVFGVWGFAPNSPKEAQEFALRANSAKPKTLMGFWFAQGIEVVSF
jgi:hypothetical protein